MSVVYVVNEPVKTDGDVGGFERKLDLTPALDYGRLVFLTPPGNPVNDPAVAIRAMWDKLHAFTASDYLLPVGHPALIGWACAIAARVTNGRVKMLRWLPRQQRYAPIEATLWPATPEAFLATLKEQENRA